MPVYQLLVYPVTTFSLNFRSVATYANAQPLNKPALVWFGSYYIPHGQEASYPFLSPLNGDVRGLPPATIIVAQIDPLLSSGKAYAAKLQDAGVRVKYRLYPGVTHEFFGMGAIIDEAHQAEEEAASDLRSAFTR